MNGHPNRALTAATVLLSTIPVATAQTINVEVDYMVDTDHSHQPTTAEIDALVQMFACHGWTLNVVVDDAIPHVDTIRCDDTSGGGFFTCTSSTYTTFKELKDAHYDGPATGWHYAVFGHNYDIGGVTNSSGYGEIGGDDFIVTLGSFTGQVGTAFDRAATFAHELGHNLGLRHQPPTTTLGGGNHQPNYASIMSYQYQLRGVRTRLECLGLAPPENLFKDLDYSSGRLPLLNEVALIETVGLGMQAIDFDCDDVIDALPVIHELDEDSDGDGIWCGEGAGLSVLRDYDDWSNIVDSTFTLLPDVLPTPADLCALAPPPSPLAPGPDDCSAAQPGLTTENCVFAQMLWVDQAASVGGDGSGEAPYSSLDAAISAATDGSILYVQPGAYTSLPFPYTITKPLTLAGPGGATVKEP